MTIQKVGNSINYIDIYIFTMTVLFIKCSVLYVCNINLLASTARKFFNDDPCSE